MLLQQPNPLLFRLASFREIVGHLGEADELVVFVSDGAQNNARPEAAAVLAQAPALLLKASDARRHLQLGLRLARRDIFQRIKA